MFNTTLPCACQMPQLMKYGIGRLLTLVSAFLPPPPDADGDVPYLSPISFAF